MRDNKFVNSMLEELEPINADHLLALQKKLGFTQRDICEILDIHYTTYQKYYVTKSASLPNTHKLFIFQALILWEKPLNYLGINRKARSYWMAWHDMGLNIPKDVDKSYTYPLSDDLVIISHYRKGVKDAMKEIKSES